MMTKHYADNSANSSCNRWAFSPLNVNLNIHNEYKVVTPPLLADYQLESWIRAYFSEHNHTSPQNIDWKQLTQYAAYHAIYEWYSLPLKFRTQRTLTELFDRRWTNKVHKFGSLEFYKDVKRIVIAHLYGFLSDTGSSKSPLMLFENMNVWVEELDIRLSMIVQVMEPFQTSFVIHKYMIDPCQTEIELFVHMTVVFCNKAFGQLPEHLHIFQLMSGERLSISTKDSDLSKSMDYLRLVKDVYTESRTCSCCVTTSSTGIIM